MVFGGGKKRSCQSRGEYMRGNKVVWYIVISILCIIFLEVFSWMFLKVYIRHSKKINGDVSLTQYWEFDPYLIWIPKNKVEGYDSYSNYKMNNYGFRNSYDIAKEKAPGSFRIIVLGGSTAWGSGASSNDTVWTAVLENILRRHSGKTVEVLNAACGGYTSFQELMYLEFKLLQFSPDMVIVLDGYNDIFMDALYPGDKYEANVSVSYYDEKKFFESGLLWQISGLILSRSNFCSLIRRAGEKIKYETGRSLYGRGYVHTKGIDNYISNIQSIAGLLKGRNIKTMFLLQPYLAISKKQLSPEEESMLSKNRQASAYMIPLMELLREKYKQFASKNALNYYDLTDICDDSPRSETMWYDHAHLNDNGNKVLAEKLGNILIKDDNHRSN